MSSRLTVETARGPAAPKKTSYPRTMNSSWTILKLSSESGGRVTSLQQSGLRRAQDERKSCWTMINLATCRYCTRHGNKHKMNQLALDDDKTWPASFCNDTAPAVACVPCSTGRSDPDARSTAVRRTLPSRPSTAVLDLRKENGLYGGFSWDILKIVLLSTMATRPRKERPRLGITVWQGDQTKVVMCSAVR